eukprot:scaffold1947_cov207-Prasinococcus_capsulatus_cf.AAC.8
MHPVPTARARTRVLALTGRPPTPATASAAWGAARLSYAPRARHGRVGGHLIAQAGVPHLHAPPCSGARRELEERPPDSGLGRLHSATRSPRAGALTPERGRWWGGPTRRIR